MLHANISCFIVLYDAKMANLKTTQRNEAKVTLPDQLKDDLFIISGVLGPFI